MSLKGIQDTFSTVIVNPPLNTIVTTHPTNFHLDHISNHLNSWLILQPNSIWCTNHSQTDHPSNRISLGSLPHLTDQLVPSLTPSSKLHSTTHLNFHSKIHLQHLLGYSPPFNVPTTQQLSRYHPVGSLTEVDCQSLQG